mmetsp:Transcript_3999/g.11632  ORF Transcript_3999/g.11632 Transcript_3999/m.11632 type:complete len:607 (-) Transcript_3999:134-1954(-)
MGTPMKRKTDISAPAGTPERGSNPATDGGALGLRLEDELDALLRETASFEVDDAPTTDAPGNLEAMTKMAQDRGRSRVPLQHPVSPASAATTVAGVLSPSSCASGALWDSDDNMEDEEVELVGKASELRLAMVAVSEPDSYEESGDPYGRSRSSSVSSSLSPPATPTRARLGFHRTPPRVISTTRSGRVARALIRSSDHSLSPLSALTPRRKRRRPKPSAGAAAGIAGRGRLLNSGSPLAPAADNLPGSGAARSRANRHHCSGAENQSPGNRGPRTGAGYGAFSDKRSGGNKLEGQRIRLTPEPDVKPAAAKPSARDAPRRPPVAPVKDATLAAERATEAGGVAENTKNGGGARERGAGKGKLTLYAALVGLLTLLLHGLLIYYARSASPPRFDALQRLDVQVADWAPACNANTAPSMACSRGTATAPSMACSRGTLAAMSTRDILEFCSRKVGSEGSASEHASCVDAMAAAAAQSRSAASDQYGASHTCNHPRGAQYLRRKRKPGAVPPSGGFDPWKALLTEHFRTVQLRFQDDGYSNSMPLWLRDALENEGVENIEGPREWLHGVKHALVAAVDNLEQKRLAVKEARAKQEAEMHRYRSSISYF